MGALVGTVGGGFVSNTLVQLNREASVDELVGVTMVGVTLGCVLGTSVGTIIGSHFRIDRWEEVPLDGLRVSFAPSRDRFAFGLSLSF